MKKQLNIKKLILLNLPYILMGPNLSRLCLAHRLVLSTSGR